MIGTVKRLVRDRGFGFIRTDDGDEYFFHRSACGRGEFDALQEGDRVSFADDEGHKKGPRAEDVERI